MTCLVNSAWPNLMMCSITAAERSSVHRVDHVSSVHRVDYVDYVRRVDHVSYVHRVDHVMTLHPVAAL